MPKAGKVIVRLSPADAAAIASWLRAKPAPLMATPRLNVPTLPNGVRVDLVEVFERIATRRRRTPRFAAVDIEFDRDDLVSFAGQAYPGMFGRGAPKPHAVNAFCKACAVALNKKLGRRALYGAQLDEAIDRQKAAINRLEIDPRHLKRLKRAKRMADEQEAAAESRRATGGLGSRYP